MERRRFIQWCMAGAAVAPQRLPAAELQPRRYARAQLVDTRGAPLRVASLARGTTYVFHYPYAGTPCFLIDLGRPTHRNTSLSTPNGTRYSWPGGVGARRTVVAYSAICSHRMTYPTPQISFISYREKSSAPGVAHPNTIHCCSEHSEFDPAAGGRVVAGPAPEPLAAILLDYDPKTDELHATATLGNELFNAFFAKYDVKLALDYGGRDRVRAPVGARTVVTELTEFCKQQIRC